MPVEDITESMHDKEGVRWFSIYDGQDFYRVKVAEDGKKTVDDYENNPVNDSDIVLEMVNRLVEWAKEKGHHELLQEEDYIAD